MGYKNEKPLFLLYFIISALDITCNPGSLVNIYTLNK